MQTKCLPEDFRVTELLHPAGPPGRGFLLLRIEKREIDALELPRRLAQTLGVPPRDISIPALKDRHGVTIQHGTLRASGTPFPARHEWPGLRVDVVGERARPLTTSDLRGNRFDLVLRNMEESECGKIEGILLALAAHGLPNCFDDQRFGSFAPGLGFPGKLLLQRRFEDVIRAYLVVPTQGDPQEIVAFKTEAQALYPNFAAIAELASKSNRRSVLHFLKDHPDGFKKACALISPELLSLWLGAYQGYLWNQVLSAYFGTSGGEGAEIRQTVGPLRLPPLGATPEALGLPPGASLALFHHRFSAAPPGLAEAAAQVIASEGFTLHDLKPRGLEKAWMAKAARPIWVRPEKLTLDSPKPDDLHPGKLCRRIAFTLPRGSYATWVLSAAEAYLKTSSPESPPA